MKKAQVIIICAVLAAVIIFAAVNAFAAKRGRLGQTGSVSSRKAADALMKTLWRDFDSVYPLDETDRAMINYANNSRLWKSCGLEGRLIENGQDNPPQNGFALGKYSFGYNGCEVIASYNFLVLCGQKPDLAKLTFEFEYNALMAKSGVLGSDPRKIGRLLENRKLDIIQLSDVGECDAALSQGKNIIFAFWTGRPFASGIHTVTITGGTDFYVLNRYNSSAAKSEISSVSELADSSGKFITAYTLRSVG